MSAFVGLHLGHRLPIILPCAWERGCQGEANFKLLYSVEQLIKAAEEMWSPLYCVEISRAAHVIRVNFSNTNTPTLLSYRN